MYRYVKFNHSIKYTGKCFCCILKSAVSLVCIYSLYFKTKVSFGHDCIDGLKNWNANINNKWLFTQNYCVERFSESSGCIHFYILIPWCQFVILFFFWGGVHIIDVCNPLFISNIDKSRNTGTQILKFKFLFFYIDSKSYLVFIF